MAQIHFELDDKLHQAIKVRTAMRGESIRRAGRRLFEWYVDEIDMELVSLCLAIEEEIGLGGDLAYHLREEDFHAVVDCLLIRIRARDWPTHRQQGGGEEG